MACKIYLRSEPPRGDPDMLPHKKSPEALLARLNLAPHVPVAHPEFFAVGTPHHQQPQAPQ
jgi:hypothetical protein